MAMLYMTKPLPLSDLDLWVQPGSKKSAPRNAQSRALLTRPAEKKTTPFRFYLDSMSLPSQPRVEMIPNPHP